MEVLQPAQIEPTEGRRIIMTAICQDCNWYSQIPTTTLRLATDSALMTEIAHQHEAMYSHKINFTTNGKG